MILTEQHKKEIKDFIIEKGGPYYAIDEILSNTGPLKIKNKHTNEFVLAMLQHIVSVRHVSFGAINDVVAPYNIYYLDNEFNLIDKKLA